MKIAFEGTFDGQSVKKDGLVVLKLKAPMTEIPNAVRVVMMVDKEVSIGVKCENTKLVVRSAVLNSYRVDRHGESTLSFDTDLAAVSVNNLSELCNRSVKVVIKTKDSADEEEQQSA